VDSSKSVDGLPATVLLWGAEGSVGCLRATVPGVVMLNVKMLIVNLSEST